MSVLVGSENGSVKDGSRNSSLAPLRSSSRDAVVGPGRGDALMEPGDARLACSGDPGVSLGGGGGGVWGRTVLSAGVDWPAAAAPAEGSSLADAAALDFDSWILACSRYNRS